MTPCNQLYWNWSICANWNICRLSVNGQNMAGGTESCPHPQDYKLQSQVRIKRKRQLKENLVLFLSAVQSSKLQPESFTVHQWFLPTAHAKYHQYQEVSIHNPTEICWNSLKLAALQLSLCVFSMRTRLVSDNYINVLDSCTWLSIPRIQQDQYTMSQS